MHIGMQTSVYMCVVHLQYVSMYPLAFVFARFTSERVRAVSGGQNHPIVGVQNIPTACITIISEEDIPVQNRVSL